MACGGAQRPKAVLCWAKERCQSRHLARSSVPPAKPADQPAEELTEVSSRSRSATQRFGSVERPVVVSMTRDALRGVKAMPQVGFRGGTASTCPERAARYAARIISSERHSSCRVGGRSAFAKRFEELQRVLLVKAAGLEPWHDWRDLPAPQAFAHSADFEKAGLGHIARGEVDA
jgi:hypothetical protein